MTQKAKHFKTRVQNKHATEAQWREAINFIPLAGELIVYDIDDTHSSPRFKIGDGIVVWNDEHTEYTITGTKINDLPFTNNIETPDWNQNDATQPGYIKNRTHYIDKPSEVITFDGDTNGKDFIDLSDNLIVKVSDNTYTVEELIGASAFMNNGFSVRLTEESIKQINGGLSIADRRILIVHNPDTFASSISEILGIPPKTNWTIGTYFIYVPSASVWVSKLNLPETAVRLDPKYLPNSLPYTESPLFNITWDGDKTDKQVIEMSEVTLVKISDEIPSDIATDFLNSQLTITENGEVVETIQIDSSDIHPVPGAIGIAGGIAGVYIIYDSDTLLANTPEEYRVNFTNGVYFMHASDPTDETYSAYISSFIGASVIHKLDSKYLPDDINVTPESLGLATVATSGNYYDLIDKPTIPAVSQFYQPTSSDAQSGKAVAEAVAEVNIKKTTSGFCPTIEAGTIYNTEITTEPYASIRVFDKNPLYSHNYQRSWSTSEFQTGFIPDPKVIFTFYYNDKTSESRSVLCDPGAQNISVTLSKDVKNISMMRDGAPYEPGKLGISLPKGTELNIYVNGYTDDRFDRAGLKEVFIFEGNPIKTIQSDENGKVPVDSLIGLSCILASTSEITAKYIPNDFFTGAALTLTFKDTNNGLPTPIAKLDNNSTSNTIYWDGTVAASLSSTAAGTEDDPIIINTVSELAYLVTLGAEATHGKYYKIADGIDKIILQSESRANNSGIGVNFLTASNMQDVRADFELDYSSFPNTEWVHSSQNAFAGHFDGNGVEIYGMYIKGNTNYSALFNTVGVGATFKNLTIKNSYARTGWFAAALISNVAPYTIDGVTYSSGTVGIENCTIANCAIIGKYENSSGVTSIPNNSLGVMFGGYQLNNSITVNLSIKNCLVYGNKISYEYDEAVEGNYLAGRVNGTENKFENSVILGCQPLALVGDYFNKPSVIKNVYSDQEVAIQSVASVSVDDIQGENAITAMPNLAWGVDWFVPTTYSGKSTPFDFTQFNQSALFNLINGNADKIDSKCITSTIIKPNNTITFDFNSLYLLVSNSGDADIILYDSSTRAIAKDSAGDNLPAVETCMLIMPKDTPVMQGKRMCYFTGLTGDFSITNMMNVVKGKHFNVNDGVSIYCTPPTANLSVFKITF